jgi:hypothetical protein
MGRFYGGRHGSLGVMNGEVFLGGVFEGIIEGIIESIIGAAYRQECGGECECECESLNSKYTFYELFIE